MLTRRIYATGISSKEQAEKLPEYDDSMTVDYDYEERVRHVYRTPIGRNVIVQPGYAHATPRRPISLELFLLTAMPTPTSMSLHCTK
jgi:stress response protein YsnF